MLRVGTSVLFILPSKFVTLCPLSSWLITSMSTQSSSPNPPPKSPKLSAGRMFLSAVFSWLLCFILIVPDHKVVYQDALPIICFKMCYHAKGQGLIPHTKSTNEQIYEIRIIARFAHSGQATIQHYHRIRGIVVILFVDPSLGKCLLRDHAPYILVIKIHL